jgi:hypothetical protein
MAGPIWLILNAANVLIRWRLAAISKIIARTAIRWCAGLGNAAKRHPDAALGKSLCHG